MVGAGQAVDLVENMLIKRIISTDQEPRIVDDLLDFEDLYHLSKACDL